MRNSIARAILALTLCAPGCRRHAAPAPAAKAPPPSTPGVPARAADAGYAFRPEERAAVDAFLREHTDLRVADDEDRRPGQDAGDLGSLYGVYHPYFVRGDANDDGLLDFVLAFVRRDSDRDAPWFSVVLFEGRSGGRFEPGLLLERDVSLADGDLSIDRDAIVVTPDISDEASRRYRWDPQRRRHVFVHDAPEEPASPPPAQT
jgi:hypothetical protein